MGKSDLLRLGAADESGGAGGGDPVVVPLLLALENLAGFGVDVVIVFEMCIRDRILVNPLE